MKIADLTSRDTLAASLPPEGVGAEIGVQQGDFAQTLNRGCRPKELFLIDCWQHQSVEVYGHDPANVDDTNQLLWYVQTQTRFLHHRHVHVLRMYSLDAVCTFANNYFDWLYFDANHLQLAEDLEAWWPKLKPGGWCCGHDYCTVGDYVTVKTAVDNLARRLRVHLNVTREPEFPAWAFRKPVES